MGDAWDLGEILKGVERMSSSMTPRVDGYSVIRPIGNGAGATIYLATSVSRGLLVALKHVVVSKPKHVRFVEQLQAEHSVCSKFKHEGLRRSLEMRAHRTLFRRRPTEATLILEYFDGVPLDQVRAEPLSKMVGVFLRISRAMHAMHSMGLVHCDLKPANVLVDSLNRIKVIDFGQACEIGVEKERIQGTPDFIAPEQVNRNKVTPATDIYNFGATMYTTLTGQKMPTLYTTSQAKVENSFFVHNRISTPAELDPSIPQPLSQLVMECVHIKPGRRPASMGIITHRLETVRHGMRLHERDAPAHRSDPATSAVPDAGVAIADSPQHLTV